MNYPVRFLLVSRKTDDAFRIKTEVERNKLYKVELEESASGAIEKIKEGDVHCLVFNFESFKTTKMPLVKSLREAGYTFPIIVFAEYVQKESLLEMAKLTKAVVIERPFEPKDVWGICEKLVQGYDVPQRVHRRFYTNQTAVFEKVVSGELVQGRIYNLSKGGAYIEVTEGKVGLGDLVKVEIHLDKVSRSYNVDAQVVWTSQKGGWLGKPAAGVRFITAGDVYRNLLEKL
ncbi:MAG: PilZ domain-containing protein [Oligoflexia bacterium]|nr:PilZ domain-containing protein [Oligoflexia bacterium]